MQKLPRINQKAGGEVHPNIQAGSPRRLCLSLHFPTLQRCIALHDPSLQRIVPEICIAPRFPYITLPYIAPNFESTGLIFVLGSCLNCSAMHSRMQCNALPLPAMQCMALKVYSHSSARAVLSCQIEVSARIHCIQVALLLNSSSHIFVCGHFLWF